MSPLVTFIALCAFSLYNAVSSTSSLYEEIKRLNSSCYPTDSCPTLWHPGYDHMWGDRICECGIHCLRFGTCCADSTHAGEEYSLSLVSQESCQKLENFPVPVFMVSKCAEGWEWPEDIRRKCENGEYSDGESLWTSAPVTRVGTYTTFKNYYCAVCNYGGSNFLYWSVGLELENPLEVPSSLFLYETHFALGHTFYNSSRKSWVTTEKSSTKSYDVSVRYVLPSYMQSMVKKCYQNLVQSCTSSENINIERVIEYEQKCMSYYSPIRIKSDDKTVYRNVHCALCNGVNASLISNEHCSLNKEEERSDENSLTSFVLLLDINRNGGDKVGMQDIPAP